MQIYGNFFLCSYIFDTLTLSWFQCFDIVKEFAELVSLTLAYSISSRHNFISAPVKGFQMMCMNGMCTALHAAMSLAGAKSASCPYTGYALKTGSFFQ